MDAQTKALEDMWRRVLSAPPPDIIPNVPQQIGDDAIARFPESFSWV